MKEFWFGVSATVIFAGLMALVIRLFSKKSSSSTELIGEEEKTKIYNEHIELMKQVYEKNPKIRSKKDVVKELNRYRDDN